MGGVTNVAGAVETETVVRQDAALLEQDLDAVLGTLTATDTSSSGPVYAEALARYLCRPVAEALGSKAGQPALPPAPAAPGGDRPLRPSMVYWAYRNYRGFPDELGDDEAAAADLAAVRRTAVAVRILLKAAVALDDIQDGSGIRYGEAALHAVHGIPVALNTANWLITAALRHVERPAVVDSLLRSVKAGFTGQAADLAARSPQTRARLRAAAPEERRAFWESVAVLKTGTLFRMPLDAATAALDVVPEERAALEEAMRRLGLASQLFNDLTDVVPEFGGANVHEDFDGLGNRVFLELLGPDAPAGDDPHDPRAMKAYVLGHPDLQQTLRTLAAEAVELKRSAKETVHRVCRSERSAAYFDVTVERKGHLIDRLHETVRRRSGRSGV